MNNSLDLNFNEIVNMIETRRNNAYKKVNEELISLYWDFGKYISEKVNDNNWGDKIVDKLAEFMKREYPTMKGFNRAGIYRMKQFYETYKDNEIVAPLVRQISWTNNVLILGATKTMEEKELQEALKKEEDLKAYFRQLKSVAVAFSGGVDSTYLLKTAHDTLGDQVIAVTAKSCSFPERELKEAIHFCEKEGIRHFVCESEELDIEGFSHNPKNRCYICKHELFEKIINIAKEQKIAYIAEGSNMDDNGDYRPGLQAVAELGVTSPLRHSKLAKEEIRILSRNLGLPTWDKQSFACLSSRFVYGEEITRDKLSMVDKAEQLLLDLGFHQVRVRIHGMMARIEVEPGEFSKVLENREKITKEFKTYGFTYVTMDLTGYRTGSMNETLGE